MALGFLHNITAENVEECVESKEFQTTGNILVCNMPRNFQRKESGNGEKKLRIFCYKGGKIRLTRLWTNPMVKIKIADDQYEVFKGQNDSDVYRQYQASATSWFNLMPWKTEAVNMKPFTNSCMGIATSLDYEIEFRIKVVDPWLVSYFIIGIILFLSAKRLSRNVLFYYGTGVSVGLCASLLIVVFIFSRLIPGKKPVVYTFLMGGWSVSLYFIQYLWENIQGILETYSHFVIGYFLIAGLISFAICYWKGPIEDIRSRNLIKWTIQLSGLICMYNSMQIPEVSVFIMVTILIIHNFPYSVTYSIKTWWRRRFPPKIRLLSEAEYIRQGDKETRKALEELKEYCRSPQCDAWKTISRLGTPQRFANWMEGDSHLTDDEILNYDIDPTPPIPLDPYDETESDIDFALGTE
ncbi:unnamed protein product [Owenia fusiformis]|uniref:Nuclear envelope integral membrane protein 1 n=1 Tax=Owenia fusiformis TaxID=6347 RepID=A0A8S4MZB0_OWEFU|nr:unnamed protein product [Owenia fusiformis]